MFDNSWDEKVGAYEGTLVDNNGQDADTAFCFDNIVSERKRFISGFYEKTE